MSTERMFSRYDLPTSDERMPLLEVCVWDEAPNGDPGFAAVSVPSGAALRGEDLKRGQEENYTVIIQGSQITCSCVGFLYRKSCSHARLVVESITAQKSVA